jgi:hypothetical protein
VAGRQASRYTGPTARQEDPLTRKPAKVTAIEVMALAGGVFGVIMGFSFMWTIVWLPWIYSYVYGILAIVIGAKLLASPGYTDGVPPDPMHKPPYFVGVMGIINILCCDIWSLTLGILILVFLGDPEVKAYYAGEWVPPPRPVPVYPPPAPPPP